MEEVVTQLWESKGPHKKVFCSREARSILTPVRIDTCTTGVLYVRTLEHDAETQVHTNHTTEAKPKYSLLFGLLLHFLYETTPLATNDMI